MINLRRTIVTAIIVIASARPSLAATVPCQLTPKVGFVVKGGTASMALTQSPIATTVTVLNSLSKSQRTALTGDSAAVAAGGASCAVLVNNTLYRFQDANNANQTIDATWTSVAAGTGTFAIPAVRTDLTAGTAIWKVAALDGTTVGFLGLQVVDKPSRQALEVHYADPKLEALQKSISASNGADNQPSVAVVNALWGYLASKPAPISSSLDPYYSAVTNTAQFAASPWLPFSVAAGYKWQLSDPSWGAEAVFPVGAGGAWTPAVAPKDIASYQSIRFAVKSEHNGPLTVQLNLVERSTGAVVLSAPLELASKASVQSLPIEVSTHVFVDCADESFGILADRGVEAVKDWSLFNNRCTINVSAVPLASERLRNKTGPYNAIPSTAALWAELQRMISAGRQTFEVRVSRSGVSDSFARYKYDVTKTIADPTLSQIMSMVVPANTVVTEQALGALPLPTNASAGDGPVSIYVTIAASAPDAEYRFPTNPLSSTALITDPSLQMSAVLRPKGPFGLDNPVRLFLTIPANIAGMRLPANNRDLRTSSDATSYEFTLISSGLLLAVEPWDYRFGRNSIPLPLRFTAGLYILNADTHALRFQPMAAIGMYVTLPVYQGDGKTASQVGTSLVVGPELQIDVRDGRPYFVFNFGFNIFTLLAPK